MTDDDVLNDRQLLKAGAGFMRQPFKIYENLRSAVSVYRGQATKGVYQDQVTHEIWAWELNQKTRKLQLYLETINFYNLYVIFTIISIKSHHLTQMWCVLF